MGLHALYGHEDIPKNYSSLKTQVRFWYNFKKMFPWPTLFKTCSQQCDPSRIMALVNGCILVLYEHEKNSYEFFFSETAR